jgi:hypothetical protein
MRVNRPSSRARGLSTKFKVSCHPERRENFAVEGPIPPAGVMGVGVLRLREFARAEQTHYAQDDKETFDFVKHCVGDYTRPTPTYSNPMERSRLESSRFLVSTIRGRLSSCLMRSKSSARNSGQPVPTTSASTPSAAA